MIFISAGIQKSGSGLFFNLMNDMLTGAGHADIRSIRDNYRLDDIVKYHNCNMEDLSEINLKRLLPAHHDGHSFVVKTHAPPSTYCRELMASGVVRAACIVRDPRDILVSAMRHGKRIRENGLSHTFASCTDVLATIDKVGTWTANIGRWLDLPDVEMYRYEGIIRFPMQHLRQLCDVLRIPTDAGAMAQIWEKYRPENLDTNQKDYLHFDSGVPGRHFTILSADEQQLCQERFAGFMQRCGYGNEPTP